MADLLNTSARGTDGTGDTGTPNPKAGDDKGTPDWKASLPGELKTHEALAKVKDVAELAKGYVDAVGKKGETPVSIDQYSFEAPAEAKDVAIDTTSVAAFKQLAFDLKVPADAANKMFQFALKREIEAHKQLAQLVETEHKAGDEAMTKAWGAEKEANRAVAIKVLKQFGGEAVEKALEKSGLARNFAVVDFLYKVGKAMSESTLKDNGPGGKPRKIETMPDGSPMLSFPSMDDIKPFDI